MIGLALVLTLFFVSLVSSVLFTSAEIAIGFISRDSLERLAENKIRGASLILLILGNKRRFQLMLISGRILSITGGTVVLYRFFFAVASTMVCK